jgi:PAS domain S-box-containing protein
MSADPATSAPPLTRGSLQTRILVTDGHPEMHLLMERALADSYECEFARSIAECREKLGTGRFQLAICKLESTGGVGLDLVGEIIHDNPDTATIVLMSGGDDPATARRAFALGVYAYVVEPFWPGQLLITVMSALRRRQLEIASRALSQNLEDRRQTIIDMAPMPIYAKDASHRYVVANARADELAGVSQGGLIGLTDDAIMPAESARIAKAADTRVLEGGLTYEAEQVVEIGDGKRTFKTVKFPLLDGTGQITAVGGISADITAENEAVRLRDELTESQQKAIDELRLSRQETIEGLAKAIELHDSSTGEHVERMANIASFLAAQMGLDPDEIDLLRAAAPMHDVGKIGTPAEILRKPGPLSAEERRIMQRHTVVGHEIFAKFESVLSRIAATIALTHHERYDGDGYPQGLAGEEIPLEGRITAVADVFDALLTDRCYRPALPLDEAVAVMSEGRGTQFDPGIVDALLDHLDEALAIRG